MKAYTFLELFKIEKCPGRETSFGHINQELAIKKYFELVNEKFEEKKILEYFEGWEYDKEHEVLHDYGGEVQSGYTSSKGLGASLIFSWDGDMTVEIGTCSSTEDGTEYDTAKHHFSRCPRIIDEFISDCDRVGVHLEFKDSVIAIKVG